MNEIAVAVLWQAAWLSCALAVFPAIRSACGDEKLAIGISLAVGPALIALPVWWLSTLLRLPFTPTTLLVSFSLLAVGSWSTALLTRELAALGRGTGRGWPFLLLHTGAFAGYAVFRSFNPAIRYTEKPMELAILSSTIVSSHLPPPDPWFASKPVNYYIFGYVEMAGLAKILGIAPEVAFNLALASLFASAIVSIGAAAGHLAAAQSGGSFRWSAAILAVFLLVGVGNWQTAWALLRNPHDTLTASWWTGPGWNASRVIVDTGFPWAGPPRPTINEFPAFSFVLGDLHPHLLALPLLGAFLGSLSVVTTGTRSVPALVLAGVLLGCLWITNTWALPLAALTVVLVAAIRWWPTVSRTALHIGLLGCVAVVVALPFQVTYIPSYGLLPQDVPPTLARIPLLSRLVRTVGVVVWERSSFGELLRAHGTLLVPGALAVGVLLLGRPTTHRPRTGITVAIAGFVAILALASKTPALVLIGIPLLVAGWLLWQRESSPENWSRALPFLVAAWSGILAVEFFYLRDVFGDRMNTVFKVYFDAWALQAVALPALLLHILRSRGFLRPVSFGLVVLALLAGALYPPLSIWKWTDGFAQAQGLDGLEYLRQAHPDEAAGIQWVRGNAAADAVVLEAPGCSYGMTMEIPHSRVSMATGRPTVLGWDGHEYQWRRGSLEQLVALEERKAALREIFESPSVEHVKEVLDHYDVTYVYIGTLERSGLGANCALLGAPQADRLSDTLEQLGWQPAFVQADVVIYARPSSSLPH